MLIINNILCKIKTRKIYKVRTQKFQSTVSKKLNRFLTFGMVMKLDSEIKFTTFQNSLDLTLSGLTINRFKLLFADASDHYYNEKIQTFLNKISTEALFFSEPNISFPLRCEKLLQKTKTDYYFMIFDDQPVIGLTNEILHASCRLLQKYSGQIDLVLFDENKKYKIDKEAKTITFHKHGSKLFQKQDKILFIEEIDGCRFAICENPRYGFVFNTLITSKQKYLKRLQWYIRNISSSSPHEIELSTALKIKRGPIFHHIAISIDAFMVDIDISASSLSVRDDTERKENLSLFDAIDHGYEIRIE